MSSANANVVNISSAFNALARSNKDFLIWIFGRDKYERAHLASFPDDPEAPSRGIWDGGPAKHWLAIATPDRNNYFDISLFKGDRRVREDFEAMYVLPVDDVGSKVDADATRALLGEPSCRIETSPGNEQWFYKLGTPITDRATAERLLDGVVALLAGAVDPGMKGVTRYMRLPFGRNLKGSLKRGPAGWDCRGIMGTASEIDTAGVLITVGRALDEAGLDVNSPRPGPGTTGAGGPGTTGTTNGGPLPDDPDELAKLDPVFRALRHFGLVKTKRPRRTSMGRAWEVTCPWVEEHTNGADNGADYVPELKYKCHHAHCENRTGWDVAAELDRRLREDSFGLVGLLDWVFSRYTGPGAMHAGDGAKLYGAGTDALGDDDNPDDDDGLADDDDDQGLTRRVKRTTTGMQRRPWVAPKFLLRGAVTMVIGAPDTGKSTWLMGVAVALVLGQGQGSIRPAHDTDKLRVLTLFAEEDEDEQVRREEAALKAKAAVLTDLDDRLDGLVVRSTATLFAVKGRDQKLVPTAAWFALQALMEERPPDVLILDPLVELHGADENSNVLLKAVIAELRSLAQRSQCAVLIAHHTGKGDVVPGSLNMARGASAIGGAVRIALTLCMMTDAEAEDLEVMPDHRRDYIRMDFARNSQARPPQHAEWFKKENQTLDNGDDAPGLVPWSPPAPSLPSSNLLDQLTQAIATGYTGARDGKLRPWSPQVRDNEARSIRVVLLRLGVNRVSEDATLKALEARGEVEVRSYTDPASKNPRQGYRVTQTGLPQVTWLDPKP
jgi:hypothetical protein